MKTQLLDLQKQRDHLRGQLRGDLKLGKDTTQTFKTLHHLDGLFTRLCEKHGLKLSKFGRLV